MNAKPFFMSAGSLFFGAVTKSIIDYLFNNTPKKIDPIDVSENQFQPILSDTENQEDLMQDLPADPVTVEPQTCKISASEISGFFNSDDFISAKTEKLLELTNTLDELQNNGCIDVITQKYFVTRISYNKNCLQNDTCKQQLKQAKQKLL